MNPRRDQKRERPKDPVILFGVGEYTFAVSATAVDEIRNTSGLKAVSAQIRSQCAKLRFLLLHAKRRYLVVDAAAHFGVLPVACTRVLVFRQSNVALLVERIDRMAEISTVMPLPRAFQGDECKWFSGLALIGTDANEVVPVINAQAFLSTADIENLNRLLAESAQ